MSVPRSLDPRYAPFHYMLCCDNLTCAQGMFVKYIQQETGTRVQIKGLGSGFVDQESGRESDEPMHIHIT